MANIIQAAAWLKGGNDVWRTSDNEERWVTPYYPLSGTFSLVDTMGDRERLTCEDLMAEDWELVWSIK